MGKKNKHENRIEKNKKMMINVDGKERQRRERETKKREREKNKRENKSNKTEQWE